MVCFMAVRGGCRDVCGCDFLRVHASTHHTPHTTHTQRIQEPPTVLKKPLVGERRLGWTKPVSLNDIKAAGKVYRATVNDVALAAVAGAIRSTFKESNTDPAYMRKYAFVECGLCLVCVCVCVCVWWWWGWWWWGGEGGSTRTLLVQECVHCLGSS